MEGAPVKLALREPGTQRREIRNGGYYGHFWSERNDCLYIAHNEGGHGPLVWNLKLKRGWLPVGFYLAVRLAGRWFRFSKGFT
jgi:hypothetical protein